MILPWPTDLFLGPSRLQAIIFDCDGVLIDSERQAIEDERAALEKLGLSIDIATYQASFSGLSDSSLAEAISVHGKVQDIVLSPDAIEAALILEKSLVARTYRPCGGEP